MNMTKVRDSDQHHNGIFAKLLSRTSLVMRQGQILCYPQLYQEQSVCPLVFVHSIHILGSGWWPISWQSAGDIRRQRLRQLELIMHIRYAFLNEAKGLCVPCQPKRENTHEHMATEFILDGNAVRVVGVGSCPRCFISYHKKSRNLIDVLFPGISGFNILLIKHSAEYVQFVISVSDQK